MVRTDFNCDRQVSCWFDVASPLAIDTKITNKNFESSKGLQTSFFGPNTQLLCKTTIMCDATTSSTVRSIKYAQQT